MHPRVETKCCLKHGTSTILRYFHMLIALMYFAGIWGFYDLPCRIPMPDTPELFAGFWKYLTYWNLFVQFLFFAFSCVTDAYKPFRSHPITYDIMIKFRDTAYASIVAPYGVFVSCMFWALYAFEPSASIGDFPAWLNHISHSVEIPVLLLESFMIRHRYPSRKVGIAFTMAFGSAYLLWIFFLAFDKNIWVYSILQILPSYGKVIFILMSFMLQIIIYLACEKVNNFFWRHH